MRVFVAGGTGVIGRSLIPPLVAAGHEVTASTRTPGRARRELGWAPRYASWRPGYAHGLLQDDDAGRAAAGARAGGRG
jgi:nucleoside-diphosphate-sugar epimerase